MQKPPTMLGGFSYEKAPLFARLLTSLRIILPYPYQARQLRSFLLRNAPQELLQTALERRLFVCRNLFHTRSNCRRTLLKRFAPPRSPLCAPQVLRAFASSSFRRSYRRTSKASLQACKDREARNRRSTLCFACRR